MPELDTLRGIAVLSVLLFHGLGLRIGLHGLPGIPKSIAALLFSGWAGVDLFFVLSGFLITGILLDSRERSDFYRRFYLRRALRILPIYYAVLLALWVLTWLGWIRHPVSFSFLGLSLVYLSNMAGLFGIPLQYAVLWSLSVEEHFYLAWPAVTRWASRRGVLLIATILCIACPILRAGSFFLGYAKGETAFGSGHTWLVADGLATGAILSIFLRSRLGTRSKTWGITILALGIGGTALVAGAPFGLLQQSRIAGVALRQTVLNFLFAGILSLFLLIGTGRWKKMVQWSVLRFFGEISYGLYLIHVLIYDLTERMVLRFFPQLPHEDMRFLALVFAMGTAFATGVAYLSRWYFEEYFLRLKDRLHSQEPCDALPESGLRSSRTVEHLQITGTA